jgi:hypothetical protein
MTTVSRLYLIERSHELMISPEKAHQAEQGDCDVCISIAHLSEYLMRSDNALRKTTVKTLQDEIAKLHVEVLQLRETNLVLSSKIKRMEVKASRAVDQVSSDDLKWFQFEAHDQSARNAIDQILSAIPALRSFRDSLISVSTSPISEGRGEQKDWVMESKDNPAATKPAASGRE